MTILEKLGLCFISMLLSVQCISATGYGAYSVADPIKPVITQGATDVTVECTNFSLNQLNIWFNSAGGAEATDNSGIVMLVPDITFAQAQDSLIAHQGYTCGLSSFVTITWVAVDDCDNESETITTATFYTEDTQDPFFQFPATQVVLNCDETTQDSLNNWVENMAGLLTGDACGGDVVFTQYLWNGPGSSSGSGDFSSPVNIPLNKTQCNVSYTVSFFIEDECGNTAVTTGSFTINDTEMPVWSAIIEDVTVSCDNVAVPDSIFGIDACVGMLIPEVVSNSDQGNDPEDCSFYNYTIARTWTAFDPCSNIIEDMHVITVVDTTKPSFIISDTLDISCSEIASTLSTDGPTDIADNCSTVELSSNDVQIGQGCNFIIERTWTAVDVCGNTENKIQVLNIEDAVSPVLVSPAQDSFVTCVDLSQLMISLTDWVDNNGYSQVTESCSALNSFAANPGTYDINNPITDQGTLDLELVDMGCPSTDGILNQLTVDFVYYDNCGNAIVTSASFGIIDIEAPVIQNCPVDVTIDAQGIDCNADYTVNLLEVLDNCSAVQSPLTFSINKNISSPNSGDPQTPVDSVLFHFGPVNLFDNPASGSINLDLSLVNVDSGEATEFFIIKGEDGSILDSTDVILGIECTDSLYTISNITTAQLNTWSADGFIDIWLVPNVPELGVFSINDVCGGSSAQMELEFEVDIQDTADPAYSVNDGDTIFVSIEDFPFDINLESGLNTLEYFYFDCGNNMTSCIQQIDVQDAIDPEISCPDDITIDLEQDSCNVVYTLPLDFEISDNCGFSTIYNETFPSSIEAALLPFKYYAPLDTFIADNVFFSFDDVNPIVQTSTEILLTIEINGDIDEDLEAYQIFGENGIEIGFTSLNSASSCDSSISVFAIEKDVFNQWAADGQIIITALAPEDDQISGGGINNCMPLSVGQDTDGVSTMFAHLSYSDAQVFYSISGATDKGSTLLYPDGIDTIIVLNGGDNIIEYMTFDDYGNEGVCTYTVTVRDNQNPTVTCQDAVIFVHPSGLEDYILSYEELLKDYSDNCAITDFSVSPELLDCSMEGEVVQVTVIATDEAGNTDSCIAQVRIETPVLEPDFTAGICEGDTLKLFANVPDASVGNAYTFSWTGPNNFSSNLENPIIPNPDVINNGTYVLDVAGFNGCNSKGTVEVFIQQLTTPEISSNLNIECLGDDLILNATSYTGDVFYLWYEGLPSSGILLQTTTNPSIILNPTLGEHNYYVEVSSPLCSTLPSLPISIEIVEAPVATVTNPFLTICEGDDISLGTDVFNPNYTYTWTGPDNYSGSGQFPQVIKDVTSVNEGLYNLMISNGACFSDTAITQVVIFNTPETPVITGDDVYCEGSSIVLSVNNVTDADLYSWYLNGNLFVAQASNTLFIPSANSSFSGDWSVTLTDGLCLSDTSTVISVFVESEFQIGISSNSPVCEGDSISLSASFIPNAQYIWESPEGLQFQGQSVTLDASEGIYTVSVTTESGCENEETTSVQIDEIPSITALSNNSQNCMDGTEDISFFPSIVPPGQYTYSWSGPQSFDSDQLNPVIASASSLNNGVYTLIVANGDCVSDPEVTVIDITDIPEQPTLNVEDIYCQGDGFVILTDTVSNAQYQWSTPIGDVTTDDPSLEILDVDVIDQGNYLLTLNVNGCLSEPSDISNVIIQVQPNEPNALSNSPVCSGDTLFFNTIQIANAEYEWIGPNGFESFDKDPFVENTSSLEAGTYQVRILLNDCPSEWNFIDVEILETPQQPVLTESSYSICDDSSSATEICISGVFQENTIHSFYVNDDLIESTEDSCITLVVGDINLELDNTITAVSSLLSCSSLSSDMVTLEIDNIPSIVAQAENNNLIICDETEVELSSILGPPDVDISWNGLENDDLVFTDVDIYSTLVSNIPEGLTEVLLGYSSGSCINYSRDTISILNLSVPLAINDTIDLNIDMGQSIDMLENDVYVRDIEIDILQEPSEGNYTIINGFVTYIPDPRFPGEHEIVYEICYQDCPDLCTMASLIINVEIPDECIVPNVITPNGDNINDAFIIACLSSSNYPDNEVKIFNEWGDEVFTAKPYLNDWEGTYNNAELPSGTYFYIVDKGDGSKPDNGFVHIEK